MTGSYFIYFSPKSTIAIVFYTATLLLIKRVISFRSDHLKNHMKSHSNGKWLPGSHQQVAKTADNNSDLKSAETNYDEHSTKVCYVLNVITATELTNISILENCFATLCLSIILRDSFASLV